MNCLDCGKEIEKLEAEEVDGDYPLCSFCAEERRLDMDIEEEWLDL